MGWPVARQRSVQPLASMAEARVALRTRSVLVALRPLGNSKPVDLRICISMDLYSADIYDPLPVCTISEILVRRRKLCGGLEAGGGCGL